MISATLEVIWEMSAELFPQGVTTFLRRIKCLRALKLIAINAAVFLALVLSANFVLWITFEDRDYWSGGYHDSRADLPNYAGQDWARNHFKEFNSLKSTYRSYYGWRRSAFEGETINIESSGRRRTSSGGDGFRIGFFGGSTMWGTGARDNETIPSLVARKLGVQAVNFGESGWRAHQSLNRLMEVYIAGETLDIVVFYDGVNEVAHGCRAELEPFSHARQGLIAERLNLSFSKNLRSFFAPIMRFTAGVARRMTTDKTAAPVPFDCSRDPAKSAFIARMLAADWDMARFIADRMGARFIGALQPVAVFSDTPLDYIDLTKRGPLEAEYKAVYPLIRRGLEGISGGDRLEYIDMTHALDTPEKVYIDWAHLSPNGNAMIADRLSDRIRNFSAAIPNRD